jgi:hypothetical protein
MEEFHSAFCDEGTACRIQRRAKRLNAKRGWFPPIRTPRLKALFSFPIQSGFSPTHQRPDGRH